MMVQPLPRVMGNMYGREDSIHGLRCISPQANGCGRQITPQEIMSWDELTIKEYRQSGWCDKCQDIIFREPDACTCDYLDVGVGVLMPHPSNELCPEHGDPDYSNFDIRFNYDPDMREDEPPTDVNLIEWAVSYD